MSRPIIAVVQFPGVNCESETVRALERVGLEARVHRWTNPAAALRRFDGFVLPGGFSYQDRVRAGALAAKAALLDELEREAARGKPVLGICNGAQVLVEAGIVPGGGQVSMALARNRMADRTGYFARWTYCRVERGPCVFTRQLAPGTVLPLPIAHGEGRFTSRTSGLLESVVTSGRAPLRYARPDGELAASYPDNPNGSELAIAAVCNAEGNVMAMMPHPERALELGAIARTVSGHWAEALDEAREHGLRDGAGPGLALFSGLSAHLAEA